MPKFSIIVPAFNAEDRIRRTLKTIRGQSNIDQEKDVELIVICDSCTDNTAKIAREEFNAIVEEVSFGNDGLSRSKGLDIATGDWVMFLDDDDWWVHEFVLDIVNGVMSSNECDFVQFGFIWKSKGYCPSSKAHGYLYSNVWTKCFKRSFIGDTRFPNVHSISDSKFIDALLEKNPKILYCDHPIYYYNWLRPGSISERSRHKS